MTGRAGGLAGLGIGTALLLCGCATRSVTLLPGEAGHPVGALAVLNPDGSDRVELTAANSRIDPGNRAARIRTVKAARIDRRYGGLIAFLPPVEEHVTLLFNIAESAPSADQEALLKRVFALAAERPGAEVQVVGHTDTLDTPEVNDRLSRRRAEEVRAYLIRRGLAADRVRATWRGEREPRVPTADGVANDANRRVEVIVR